jgi:hypothetical protein
LARPRKGAGPFFLGAPPASLAAAPQRRHQCRVPPSASPAQTRRRCVFTSAGDRNVVAGWLPPDGARDFDLFVAFYGEDEARFAELSHLADRVWRIKGGKAQNLRALVLSGELDLSPYTHVWLPDDDLLLAPADIPRLFDLAEHFGFAVCQPAFDPLGKVSWPITAVAENRDQARLTDFVEMTCPLFRREELERFLAVFDGSLSGEGLDLWYGHVLGADIPGRFGIIDAITVFNPHPRQRPGGFREIDTLRSRRERVAEMQAAIGRHGFARKDSARCFGTRPNPPGWRLANPLPHPAPRMPLPSDVALTPAEAEFLARVLSPPPRAAVQLGVDGLTARLLDAGAELVAAADRDHIWLRSCLHDPALARPAADGRLLIRSRPPAASGAGRLSSRLMLAALEALAARNLWPELVVAPAEEIQFALRALRDRQAPGMQRPAPRTLLTSTSGAAPEVGTIFAGLLTADGEGRFRLLRPIPRIPLPAVPGGPPRPESPPDA